MNRAIRRTRTLLLGCASVLTIALAWAVGVPAANAAGPFPITESFRNTTTDPNWVLSGSSALTANTGDAPGNGWLRLTGAVNTQFGVARNTQAFPSTNGILAEFQYATWGGSGADGLVFFLYDGSTDEAQFHTGPAGGSIGYTNCPQNGSAGLKNAYIGVAFDEWGNFANSSFCNQLGGFASPEQPNRVVIRGSEAAGYPYLTSAATSQSLIASRAQARNVKVSVTPDMKMSVYITYPDGAIQTVTQNYQLPAAPATLKLGYVAATGGSTNNHEIRNTQVVKPTDLVTTVTDGVTGASRSAQRTWTATVTNDGPNATANSTIVASAPASTLANASWTCAASVGSACATASGTGLPDTQADLAVNGKVTYTITADAAATADDASLSVTANTGAGEETGEANPTNNAQTDATDLTPVADVDPTASLVSGGTASRTSAGTWRGGNLSYSQNWQRCDADGTGCVDIAGATNTAYTTQADDAGKTLRLRVRATNSAGSTDAYSSAFTLPDTAIISAPAARIASGTGAFGFSTTGPGGTTYQCSLDGAAWSSCATPVTFTGLADGGHDLKVRAVYGGLVDPTPAQHGWTIDRVTAVALAGPTAGTIANRRPTVSGTAEANASLEVIVDGATVATGVAAGDGTFAIVLPADLVDGAHTVAVKGTDDLGNHDTDSVTLTVDATAPDVPGLTGSPSPLSGTPTATFTISTEPGATLKCRLDGGAWTPCTMPVTFHGLPDGPHTFSVISVDPYGNESPRRDYTWTVDTDKPSAPPVMNGPATSSKSGKARFDISVEPGATLECSLDGATWAACTSPVELTGLGRGKHQLLVRQVDAAGNLGAAARYDWSVGTTERARTATRLQTRVADRTSASDNRRLAVGCVLNSATLRACTVKAYQVGPGGRRVLVGTGRARIGRDGHRSTVVHVRLNARGRTMLARAAGGMRLRLTATAHGRGSRALRARTTTVVQRQSMAILPTINPFVFDSTQMINASAYRALRSIAAQIRRARSVTCVGHTDSAGSAVYNRALGMRRAQTVCNALHQLGVRAQLHAFSDGETQPRASNATSAGRQRNRRVELRIAY
jgi:outer membrane protein OmpA-like peptidoglycan-associated protein